MPVQVFVDDSGGKGQTKNFVLAGLVSDSERWAHFSLEWASCLGQYPHIKVFKMNEAASLTGAFYRFTEEQRDRLLQELAQIINRHVEFAIWTMIDLEAHAQTWGKLEKPKSEAYFWAFHTLILGTCFDLWEECGWKEPFEAIFDEQLIFGERARSWYPLIRELMQSTYPQEFTILPSEPMFAKDDDRLPIQAADLWAWCLRKNTDNPTAKSFEWLLEEMKNVSQSNYCNYYDRERMSEVIKESIRIAQAGIVPSNLVPIYKAVVRKKNKTRN